MAPRITPETTTNEFWSKVEKSDGCWEWKGTVSKDGYGRLSMGSVPRRRLVSAHRFSYELAFGDIPQGMGVLHRCDNPGCVRPDHLFLGTQADNAKDMARKGRGPGLKIMNEQVPTVRAMHASGEYSYSKIAAMYGVSPSAIQHICSGFRRQHI